MKSTIQERKFYILLLQNIAEDLGLDESSSKAGLMIARNIKKAIAFLKKRSNK